MINLSGKIGVDKAGPTYTKWTLPATFAAVKGAMLKQTAGVPALLTAAANAFALSTAAFAATDTSTEVALVSKGSKVIVDFAGDTLIHDGGAVTTFSDDTVTAPDNVFIGAQLQMITGTQAGKIFTITDFADTNGVFTLDPTPAAFTDGDTARIINAVGAKANMVGRGPVLDATASYSPSLVNAWNSTNLLCIDVLENNKLLCVVLLSDF